MARTRDDGGEGEGTLAFLQLLWRLDHTLQRLSKGMAAGLGITGPQRLALRVIGRAEGISPGDLARRLCLHPSTVTGIVQRLEAALLVTRTPVPGDGRRSLLALTKAGRPLARPSAGTVEEAARRTLARCGDEEVASARRVLELMSDELEGATRRLASGRGRVRRTRAERRPVSRGASPRARRA